ncbi:MAG: hypothetical protein RR922_05770 [Clostridia bacterium]
MGNLCCLENVEENLYKPVYAQIVSRDSKVVASMCPVNLECNLVIRGRDIKHMPGSPEVHLNGPGSYEVTLITTASLSSVSGAFVTCGISLYIGANKLLATSVKETLPLSLSGGAVYANLSTKTIVNIAEESELTLLVMNDSGISLNYCNTNLIIYKLE